MKPHRLKSCFAALLTALPLAAQTPPSPTPEPDRIKTEITVVGNVKAEAPASMTIIGAPEVQAVPGVNLDDRLRQVPGFSLFRRSSGLVANPTTQGISLRGLGSTGASRTLVLWDAVPLNDPFGGWVYWTRVAPESISQIEVTRGASTSVFGDRAMSGSISLFSKPIDARHYYGAIEGGNRGQVMPSAGYWDRVGNWGFGAQARAFQFDGYYIVPATIRGRIDTPANVEFVTGDARVDYTRGAHRVGLKFDVIAEGRDNGTPIQTNSTSVGSLGGNYAREWSRDSLSVTGFFQSQEFRAGFSAIPAGRNTETLTFRQSVPAQAGGGSAVYRHSGSSWSGVFGADMNRVNGISYDFLNPTGVRSGGGTINQRGFFGQTDFRYKDLRVFLGAREQLTGLTNRAQFFSPSAGFTYGRGEWRTRGSVYRALRSPTLNELYREFRAGNTVTQANPGMTPETLFGAEVGADWIGERSRAGVTFFRSELNDIITNVTLSTTPALVTRQRQNFGSALSRGIEVDLRHQFGAFRWDGSYLFVDSRFSTGLRLPQVARHYGSSQLTWNWRRTSATGSLRSSSLQFEDDRNTQLLPGYAAVQGVVRQQVTDRVSLHVAIENLLNRSYLTGFTPAAQIGPPRLWRVGMRWEK
jgi:outer membrane receptor protein involved in Fe transport